MVFRTKEKA
jgi:hypothetical protein